MWQLSNVLLFWSLLFSFSCTTIVTRLLQGGANVGLKNNFQRTPLQYFNQDAEQQTPQQQAELEQRLRQEKGARQRASETDEETLADRPSLKRQKALSYEQIDHLQKEFAEFRKNMTEGVIDEDRRQIDEEKKRSSESEDDDREEKDEL